MLVAETIGTFWLVLPTLPLFLVLPGLLRMGIAFWLALAASCLRILSYGNIGYAYGMVMLQAFNGAGDTITPTWVNLFGFWFLEIPLAYWLAIPMNLRSKGAFFSIVIAECAIAAAGILLFRRGRWKQQKI